MNEIKVHFMFFLQTISMVLITMALPSCSLNQTNENPTFAKPVNKVVEFYLPSLPSWANFSTYGQCHRGGQTIYFDFSKLGPSYNLSYEQMIQFQLMYNKLYQSSMSEVSTLDKSSLLKEEELFFNVLNKVQNNVKAFLHPNYKRVHLILADGQDLSRLKETNVFIQGHPVIVSFCLNHGELIHKIEKEIGHVGAIALSYEMLSIFDSTKKKTANFHIDLNHFFHSEKKVYLYLPKGAAIPLELVGSFKVQYY